MIKICFVCLGNICRSPMAEFIMKKKVLELNLQEQFFITSRATSYEEFGNDIYPPAKKKLSLENIPYAIHKATRLEKTDYAQFDYFICMEQANVRNTLRIFEQEESDKVFRLFDITATKKDIADPWYTNNFDRTYKDLDEGIDFLIKYLLSNKL